MKSIKTLSKLKILWSVLCILFAVLALFNFLMPDSYSGENMTYRLFYFGMAILFAVSSVSFRAVIKALEEMNDQNIK